MPPAELSHSYIYHDFLKKNVLYGIPLCAPKQTRTRTRNVKGGESEDNFQSKFPEKKELKLLILP